MNPTHAIGSVLLLARGEDLRDGLRRYFEDASILCEVGDELRPLSAPPDSIRVVIVFPDDFRQAEVATYLAILRERRPNLLLVVVTRAVETYESMAGMTGRPLGATVYARPSFGWATLDPIRDLLGHP